ncbi:MAG: class I SAM-dependent methyltransferase [Aeromicrobium sp.]
MTARFSRVVIDLGTGTGQSVLRAARRAPDVLVIGVDTDAAAMREASHAAARPERRGGLPNSLFLVEAAEALPGPLSGRADLVTVALPWGSLLRGLLSADRELLGAVTALLKPRGEIELLLSTAPSDGLPVRLSNETDVRRLADAYESAGLNVLEWRVATAGDIAELSSGWGRRLGIPERRTAWIFRLGNESGQSSVTWPSNRGGHRIGATSR